MGIVLYLQRGIAPDGPWPITIAGWATLVMSILALGFLVYDKIAGKTKAILHMESKLDTIASCVEDIEATQTVFGNSMMTLNKTMLELTFELRGVDGQNGAKGDIKEIRAELAQIQTRNRKMDILAAAFEEQQRYEGPERREVLRRIQQGRRKHDNDKQ